MKISSAINSGIVHAENIFLYFCLLLKTLQQTHLKFLRQVSTEFIKTILRNNNYYAWGIVIVILNRDGPVPG